MLIIIRLIFAGIISFVLEKRNKALARLRKSEERIRLMFNSGNDAIFVHQLSVDRMANNFIEVNDMACERLGYIKEELLEKSPSDISRIDDEILKRNLEVLYREKHSVIEAVHLTKYGLEIPVEINSHLFEVDGVPSVMSIAMDIT